MSYTFQKVQSGQPLAIPAHAYNAMLESAEAYQKAKLNGGAGLPQGGYNNIVRIKNASGSDVTRFEILGISDIIFSPADAIALVQFKNNVVLSGATPSTTTHAAGKFVVCAEPIANGSYGLAYAHGVCQVQINVTDAGHAYADVTNSDHSKLTSAESGPAAILWKESGTGTKWAVIRFGGAGGGGAASLQWAEIMHEPDAGDTEYDIKLDAWNGDWGTGQSYVQYSAGPPVVAASIVKYLDREWTCIATHASNDANKPPNASYWQEVVAVKGYSIYTVGDLSTCSPIFYTGMFVPVVLYDSKYWILQTFTQCGIKTTVGITTVSLPGSNIWVAQSTNDAKGRLASIYV